MSEWISVEEELPETDMRVLFLVAPNGIPVAGIAAMDKNGTWLDEQSDAYNEPLEWYAGEVSHWMPLPEPPNKEK